MQPFYIDKIKPDKWGLSNSNKKLKAQSAREVVIYNGTADDFLERKKRIIDGTEYLVVKDYREQKWEMARIDYDNHTSNTRKKLAFRTNYLNEINNIVSDPDEVWLDRDHNSILEKNLTSTTII